MQKLPLQYIDGPDYCEVKDAAGASFALTMQPDLMRQMERSLELLRRIEHTLAVHGHMDCGTELYELIADLLYPLAAAGRGPSPSEAASRSPGPDARMTGHIIEQCAKIAEPWPGFWLDENSTEVDCAVVGVRTEIAAKIRALSAITSHNCSSTTKG